MGVFYVELVSHVNWVLPYYPHIYIQRDITSQISGPVCTDMNLTLVYLALHSLYVKCLKFTHKKGVCVYVYIYMYISHSSKKTCCFFHGIKLYFPKYTCTNSIYIYIYIHQCTFIYSSFLFLCGSSIKLITQKLTHQTQSILGAPSDGAFHQLGELVLSEGHQMSSDQPGW